MSTLKTVDRDSSTQVLDRHGKLVATFPTAAEAKAFVTGHATGVKDSAERVSRRANELMDELRGMA